MGSIKNHSKSRASLKSLFLFTIRRWLFARAYITTLWARAVLNLWGIRPGPDLVVQGRLRVRLDGDLRIGKRVRIHSGSTNFVGGDRRMAIWVSSGAMLEIGDGCALSNSTIVCRERIEIRADTFIGGGCDIYDNDFHPVDPDSRIMGLPHKTSPVLIGPRAFLAAGVKVLKGVSIGEGAVVGAGSVVTKDVPPYEIWAGAPARAVGRVPLKTK